MIGNGAEPGFASAVRSTYWLRPSKLTAFTPGQGTGALPYAGSCESPEGGMTGARELEAKDHLDVAELKRLKPAASQQSRTSAV